MARIGIGLGIDIGGMSAAGNGPATNKYLSAFTADLCNYPWYTATTPSSQYFASVNKTIQVWEAYIQGSREIHVAAYDHTAKTWTKTNFVGNHSLLADDHGVPSICQDNAGYFWIFGGAHHTAMVYYRSNNVNDLTAFTEQTAIAGEYTYPHPNMIGGLCYLFMRKGGGGLDPRYLSLYVGDPSSGTMVWGSEIIVGDNGVGSRWYLGTHIILGTDIYMASTYADAADTYRQNVYLMIYNTLDGSVRNLAGNVTVASASFPVALATMNASFEIVATNGTTVGSGNIPQICFDTSGQGTISGATGNLHFAYMDGLFGAPFNYLHVMWNGSVLSSPHTVGVTGTGDLHRYDALTVAPNGSGGVDYMFTAGSTSYVSTRGGDMKRSSRSSAGAWSAAVMVQQAVSPFPLDACVMVRDGLPEYNITYGQISYLGTIGVTGTESGITQAYAVGDSFPIAYITRGPYGPDEAEYVAKLSGAPATAVRQALKNLIDFYRGTTDATSGLKLWQLTPHIYPLLAQDAASAIINLRQPRFDLTQNGSPTFVGAYKGFTGVASGYWDLGLNLGGNFSGTNFRVNGAYNNNATTQSLIGTATSTDLTFFHDGTTLTTRIGGSETALATPFAVAACAAGMSRTGTTLSAFGNGAKLGTHTATNANFQNNHIFINRRTTLYSLATHYFWEFGFYVDDASQALIHAAIKTFVNAVGNGISI